MSLELIEELEFRNKQAALLLNAAKISPGKVANDPQAASRARFLGGEIASLTERASKQAPARAEVRAADRGGAVVPMTVEKFKRELAKDFPEVRQHEACRIAKLRAQRVIPLQQMLDAETDEQRASVIAERIGHFEAEIREEERLEALVRSDLSAEELRTHGVRVVPNAEDIVKLTGKRNYRSLFGAPQGQGGFRNLSELGSLILSGRADDRLSRAAHGASTLLGADGGFLIPDELVVELFNSVLEQSVVMNRASVVSLINGSRLVAGFDESSRANGSIYGFTSDWIGEGETMTPQKPKFRQMMLKARKLAIFSAMTNELLADALNGGSALDEALARAIAFSLDRALLVTGQGTTSPVAVLKSDSKLKQSKESGQAAGTILYKNLSKMSAKLAPEFEKNAVWLASPSTRPQLMETSIELIEDVAAAHVPVLTSQGGKSYILGREVVWSEHLPTLGTEGDLMLCDLSAYSVGIAKEISVDRSSHVYFSSDETAFRCIVRCDAQSKLATTITSSNSDVLSWLVTLETRA